MAAVRYRLGGDDASEGGGRSPSVASVGSLWRVLNERRDSSAAVVDRHECPLLGLRAAAIGAEKNSTG
jgi:hypothetical protein